MTDHFPPGFNQFLPQLKNKLNFSLEKVSEIKAGGNNRLFILKNHQEQRLLLKFYFRDNRHRLEREYSAFEFLHKNNITVVPRPYIKNVKQYCGVYSFEEGKSKEAAELNLTNIDHIVDFLVSLHQFTPKDVQEKFDSATLACFCYQDYIDNILRRRKIFQDFLKDRSINIQIKHFSESVEVVDIINKLIKEATKKISSNSLKKRVPLVKRRLCPTDFGPHNMLFREDRRITFVDFEYFGWDDPIRLLSDLIVHDQTIQLSHKLKKRFLKLYFSATNYSSEEQARASVVFRLIEIEWLVAYLTSISPERIKTRAYADPQFEPSSYINEQLEKFDKRLTHLKTKAEFWQ